MKLNERAWRIVEELKKRSSKLQIKSFELEKGATVLDCGVREKGGLEAGRLYSQACLGGLARVWITKERYGKIRLPTVNVETEEPRLACIGSQKAGWRIKAGDFFALGSGPARMLKASSSEKYRESADEAVLSLECSALPGDEVAGYVAGECGIGEKSLALLAARTASLVGSTQISARMVETAIFKMDRLGFDVNITHASGSAPIAPVIGGDDKMMGATNDMIIYGSSVNLKVEGELDVEPICSKSSSEYGMPFLEVFKRSGYDFYRIDQDIFGPAQITVENVETGQVKSAGLVNTPMIEKTLTL
jgi:methenyltetrahydromethanopterin cyclohydrolase